MHSLWFLLMLFSLWLLRRSLCFFACGHKHDNHEDTWFIGSDTRLKWILLMFNKVRRCVKKCKDTWSCNIRTHDYLKCPYFEIREDNIFKTCVLIYQSMCPYVTHITSLLCIKCVLTYLSICPHVLRNMSSWLIVYVPTFAMMCPHAIKCMSLYL